MSEFFKGIDKVKYEGPSSANPLAFRYYNKDESRPRQAHGRQPALRRRLLAQLRLRFPRRVRRRHLQAAVVRRFHGRLRGSRPTRPSTSSRSSARRIFCFHDADVRPEGDSYAKSVKRLNKIADIFEEKMAETGVKLLWGTANLFSNPRFMSGAATNPDPDVFAYAAATIKANMDVTERLNGANYVLWGGREGYETLLNTKLGQELDQMARMLQMVVDYKHKIGFKGTILIEPKPQEPTKHQYDYDVGNVYGFLKKYGLEKEVKVNIEVGHAFLAKHTFEHEIALAAANGIFGSIDMNRNDLQSGWDTDQFPNNVPEVALAYYHILKAGGFTTGGTNFDSKVRRQSIDRGRPGLCPYRRHGRVRPRLQGRRGDHRGRLLRQVGRRPLCRLEVAGSPGHAQGRAHPRRHRQACRGREHRSASRVPAVRNIFENLINRFV